MPKKNSSVSVRNLKIYRYYSLTGEIIEKRESVDLSDNGDNYILTEREEDILRLKTSGLRNKEIADKLSISPETVRNHNNHILHKLKSTSMSQAIAFAYERGILKVSKMN
ncbi:MAG: response regulator transcription factor [Nitrospinae bacterium]|nr:response regulator transcription factor [Nitrospinota bacterium]